MHQLVQAVPALTRPGSPVDHDLAHEVVEKVAAADERGGREAARNPGSLDVGGFGILELRHEVEALAGVAELAAEGRIGLVGQGLGQSRRGLVVVASAQKPGGWSPQPKQRGGARSPSLKRSRRMSGRGRLAVVPLDEGAVGERFDHDVSLAVERRGALREERRDERERHAAEGGLPPSSRGSLHGVR